MIPFSCSMKSLRFLLEVLFEGIQYAENVTEKAGSTSGTISIGNLVHISQAEATPSS